jgi:hypothetical protein
MLTENGSASGGKLTERDFVEQMTIDNLSLLQDKDGRQQLRIRDDLKGRSF